ncbi:MAG: hypothetical protein MH825_06895 [Cyanobacteria bacterium]|nr:hypothetical protein [Cyanobacteriota bacterium]
MPLLPTPLIPYPKHLMRETPDLCCASNPQGRSRWRTMDRPGFGNRAIVRDKGFYQAPLRP